MPLFHTGPCWHLCQVLLGGFDGLLVGDALGLHHELSHAIDHIIVGLEVSLFIAAVHAIAVIRPSAGEFILCPHRHPATLTYLMFRHNDPPQLDVSFIKDLNVLSYSYLSCNELS